MSASKRHGEGLTPASWPSSAPSHQAAPLLATPHTPVVPHASRATRTIPSHPTPAHAAHMPHACHTRHTRHATPCRATPHHTEDACILNSMRHHSTPHHPSHRASARASIALSKDGSRLPTVEACRDYTEVRPLTSPCPMAQRPPHAILQGFMWSFSCEATATLLHPIAA